MARASSTGPPLKISVTPALCVLEVNHILNYTSRVKFTATGSEFVVRSLFEIVCDKCDSTVIQTATSCKIRGQAHKMFNSLTGSEELTKVTFTYSIGTKNIQVQSAAAYLDSFATKFQMIGKAYTQKVLQMSCLIYF